MSMYTKIILIIFGLAYLISPVDIIPDIMLPYIGWLDDGVVLATLFYLIRHGRLPDFIFKKRGLFSRQQTTRPRSSNTFRAEQNGRNKTNTGPDNEGSHKSTPKREAPLPPKTPWQILGVPKTASKKEIQAAYKEAIKKYHPDKLSHLGEDFSNLANEKFLEIQKAYDALMKQY